jgi:hypothetical protein
LIRTFSTHERRFGLESIASVLGCKANWLGKGSAASVKRAKQAKTPSDDAGVKVIAHAQSSTKTPESRTLRSVRADTRRKSHALCKAQIRL